MKEDVKLLRKEMLSKKQNNKRNVTHKCEYVCLCERLVSGSNISVFLCFADPKVSAEDWYPSYSNWENNSDWSIPPAALHCLYMKSQTNMGKSALENVNI